MARFLLPLLILASSLSPGAAGAEGSWSRTTISAAELNDVAFVDERTGWVVGNGGTTLRTTDGGLTWASQSASTSQHLNGVDFVDAQRGWAVGAASTIRSTTNGGQTWTARSAGVDAVLMAVDFVDATHGWAVGNTALLANLVLATTDGGLTWTPQVAPAGIGLLAVSFADRLRGFAVGYLDAAYRTEDGGATWIPMAVKAETFEGLTTDSFYATVRASASDGLLGGFRGEIYRTRDGGLTWSPAGVLGKPVRGLAISGPGAFASGDAGVVARSDDEGSTWQLGSPGTTANLRGITAVSASAAFTVGAGGALVTYRDAAEPALPLDVSLLPEDCADLPIPVRHGTAGHLVSGVAADVDGDGSTEIVVAGTEGIRALRPFVPTELATIWYRPFQASIRRVRLAETDGDPRPELIVSTGGSGGSRTGLLALDAESGAEAWSRRLPSGVMTFQVDDLDADGLDDVFAVTQARDVRAVSGVDGSDLWPPVPLAAQALDLELVDLSGDGLPEAVLPMIDGRATALDGATGAPRWTYRVDGEFRSVASGDLTGDGTPDVILGGTGVPGSVTPGRGDDQINIGSVKGGLVAAVDGRDGTRLWDYGQNNPFLHFDGLALGDLNGDGTRDVVGSGSRFAGSHLIALDGLGRRVNGVRTGEPLVLWRHNTSTGEDIQSVTTPDDLTLRDGDGDGTLDAFVAQHSGDLFAVSGRPPVPSATDPADPPDAARIWLASRDWYMAQATPVDVDGRLLILAISGDGLLALRDPASGAVEWAFDGGVFPAVGAGDLDGDGDAEPILGTSAGRVYGLGGDGAPLVDVDVFLPDRVVDVAALDLDGDGRDEIVAATVDGTVAGVDPRAGEILWDVHVNVEPTSLAAGDGVAAVGLDDGRLLGLDAATGEEAWQVPGQARLNDVVHLPAAGLFASGDDSGALRLVDAQGSVVAEGFSDAWINGMAAGDLDGDGVEEIVAASGLSFRAFGVDGLQRWSVSTGQSASIAAVGDMDGDGRGDVVGLALGSAHGIRGWDGADLWEIIESGWPGGAAVADLDGDGAGEGLVGSQNGRIRAVRSDGAVLADCRLRKVPDAMTAADLDGDGVAEAVVAMREGDTYVVGGS